MGHFALWRGTMAVDGGAGHPPSQAVRCEPQPRARRTRCSACCNRAWGRRWALGTRVGSVLYLWKLVVPATAPWESMDHVTVADRTGTGGQSAVRCAGDTGARRLGRSVSADDDDPGWQVARRQPAADDGPRSNLVSRGVDAVTNNRPQVNSPMAAAPRGINARRRETAFTRWRQGVSSLAHQGKRATTTGLTVPPATRRSARRLRPAHV